MSHKRVYITVGQGCNLSCSYCSQDHTAVFPAQLDAPALLAKVAPYDALDVVFFGGEPLLYLEQVKAVVEVLEASEHACSFALITNGLLLTQEVAYYCNDHAISVALSHDGPAQGLRSPFDPLADKTCLSAFLRCQNRSISCVVSADNADLLATTRYFTDFFAQYDLAVPLRWEFLHVHDPVTAQRSLIFSPCFTGALKEAVRIAFNSTEVSTEADIYRQNLTPYLTTLQRSLHTATIREGCGVTSALHLDLAGSEYPCHNLSVPGAPTNTYFQNGTCVGCPALMMCGGGCSIVPQQYKFHDCYVQRAVYLALSTVLKGGVHGTV